MDSFTDDLNSSLPKQMQSEMMDDVKPSSLLANDCAAFTARRVGGRPAIALRPLSERLGRTTLQRGTLAIASKVVSSEDPFRNLSDDILEHILAWLPLFHLEAAKKVCRRWASVTCTPEFDILRKELNPKPCLVRYGFNYRDPGRTKGYAYDVDNDAWVTLPGLQLPALNDGSLDFGNGASGVVFAVAEPGWDRLLYKLTSSASSAKSFRETWCKTPVMTLPRSSPVVSVALGAGMGHKVVVAGGGSRRVEVFDSEIGKWFAVLCQCH